MFDIDGTLIRWQLYHAVADELARRGHFDQTSYQAIRNQRMHWKNRRSPGAFKDYEKALVNLVDAALTGVSVEALEWACRAVILEYKDQVYTFTRDLIKELKAKDYLIFAISGSQETIVGMLAEYYGFDGYGGSVYEIEHDHFTGKKDVLTGERKPEHLAKLAKEHQATYQGSIGVGDSDGDIQLLSVVETPIAFNPSQELYDHARKQGWRIVVERKNVTYNLETTDGTYLLA